MDPGASCRFGNRGSGRLSPSYRVPDETDAESDVGARGYSAERRRRRPPAEPNQRRGNQGSEQRGNPLAPGQLGSLQASSSSCTVGNSNVGSSSLSSVANATQGLQLATYPRFTRSID